MKTQISIATNSGIARLNEREPQHPPDVYFIKRNERYLKSYLNDSRKVNSLVQRADLESK